MDRSMKLFTSSTTTSLWHHRSSPAKSARQDDRKTAERRQKDNPARVRLNAWRRAVPVKLQRPSPRTLTKYFRVGSLGGARRVSGSRVSRQGPRLACVHIPASRLRTLASKFSHQGVSWANSKVQVYTALHGGSCNTFRYLQLTLLVNM